MKVRNSYFAPMVIGRGLLASAFQHFSNDDDVIVFASGVSNSMQQSKTEFEREKTILFENFKPDKKLIYFSTISVYDQSIQHSPYIIHKLEMEKTISESSGRYIIFRLPILAGKTDNPYTLINFIYGKIMSGERFSLFENACRYLMDVDDVARLLSGMIRNSEFDNQILDINFNNKKWMPELIAVFEQVLQRKANVIREPKGNCYEPRNEKFLAFIGNMGFEVAQDYELQVLKKYYATDHIKV